MGSLYDKADIYDLIESEDRYKAYKKHWENLFEGKKIVSMLDISIGSGSVTLPVLDLGIALSGSDLSNEMLARCNKKISDKGFDPDLKTADFRDLSCWGDRKFDVVASTGNSLAYVSNEDVLRVLEQMDEHVSDNGYIYIDIRNWDKILREKKRFYLYDPFFVNGERVNLMQVWDYNTDGSMTFNLLYTFEKDRKIYRKETFEEHYNPISKGIITDKLKELGYSDIQLYSFPSNISMDSFENIDWYTILAKR
ncbi:MAG: class I SAM-dependent methyltransferase [Lachnospiraceae bacterium]|nr:class I SAM-dependent methyltransferase [Lachnospiraceae bacterium]